MHSFKLNLAICGGNALEWCDYAIYAQLSPIIAPLFFPSRSLLHSLFLFFISYFLTFAVRPLGGLILGKIGDLMGRRKMFLISSFLMSISMLGIALLPTHNSIGWLATLMLILLRLVQGLGISVEFPTAISYQIEKQSQWATFFATMVQSSTFLGVLGASLIITLLSMIFSHQILIDWAWRIPFLILAILSLFNFLIRIRLPESITFIKKDNSIHNSNIKSVRKITKPFILSFFIPAAATTGVYFFTYQISYINVIVKSSLYQATIINFIVHLIIILLIPLVTIIFYKSHIEKTLKINLLLLILFAPLLFWLMGKTSLKPIIIGELLFSILLSPYLALNVIYMGNLYPVNIRISVCFR